MKEEIKFTGCDQSGDEQEYALRFDNDCISIIDCITDKELCAADWAENLRPIFQRALEIWPGDSAA